MDEQPDGPGRAPGDVPVDVPHVRDDPPRQPVASIRALPPVDPPLPPPAALARHRARVLDPTTALRIPGQPAPRTTVYVADRLLIASSSMHADVREHLDAAAADYGLKITVLPTARRLQRVEDHNVELVQRVRLEVADDDEYRLAQPVSAPDAWAVLQSARLRARRSDIGVSLDHLMQVCTGPNIGGNPYSHPSGKAFDPTGDYGLPGHGARMPVAWIGPDPIRSDVASRRPRVAILDTGTEQHPWFDGPGNVGCLRRVDLAGSPFASEHGLANALEGDLADDAGHGTFIAGLIRQTCPDADVVSIKIMADDGLVAEGALIEALQMLLDTHLYGQIHNDPRAIVDVVSLSLGYYHEHAQDGSFDALLLQPLQGLAQCGVAVVASAGNDATTRPLYPAAFSPNPRGPVTECATNAVPLVGVGALNPNGTVALFSNAGAWVCAVEAGASVVSAMPAYKGGAQPAYRVTVDGLIRENLDMDDFSGGFASWSGTSFAAPILAGKLARSLLDSEDLNDLDADASALRCRTALAELTTVAM